MSQDTEVLSSNELKLHDTTLYPGRMKFGVGARYFLIVSLAVTVWHTSAQAPGDEDSRCLNDRSAVGDVYPPDVRMLMDSRNYENLITGTHQHCQQLNVDGTGTGVGGSHSIKQYIR